MVPTPLHCLPCFMLHVCDHCRRCILADATSSPSLCLQGRRPRRWPLLRPLRPPRAPRALVLGRPWRGRRLRRPWRRPRRRSWRLQPRRRWRLRRPWRRPRHEHKRVGRVRLPVAGLNAQSAWRWGGWACALPPGKECTLNPERVARGELLDDSWQMGCCWDGWAGCEQGRLARS